MAEETDQLRKEIAVRSKELGRETSIATAEGTEDTEQIKARIEETRNNMGETIDAIQDRLSFANISEQVSDHVSHAIETAKDTVYEATIGKAVNYMKYAGNEISDTAAFKAVKENPVPYALIGLGSGLLIYNSLSGKRRRAGFDTRSVGGSQSRGLYDRVSGTVSGATESVSRAAGSTAETVSGAASSAAESVRSAANSTLTGVRDAASTAYEKAGELGHAAHETYDHYIEEKPLAVGAVALALGAAVGFALPSTRYEDELIGEARTDLLNKAESTATQFVDRAKEAAATATETFKEEVSRTQPNTGSH